MASRYSAWLGWASSAASQIVLGHARGDQRYLRGVDLERRSSVRLNVTSVYYSRHVTSRALLRLLTSRRFGCVVIRQRGSHVLVQCGACRAVIPMHDRDLAPGTWAAIRSALVPCLGERWWWL